MLALARKFALEESECGQNDTALKRWTVGRVYVVLQGGSDSEGDRSGIAVEAH